jgi:hypothetical protein
MADVSKRTVLILLILVIISTLVSTWAFLSSISAPTQVYVSTPQTSEAKGNIKLEIIDPPVSTTTGEVQLEIIEPPEGG